MIKRVGVALVCLTAGTAFGAGFQLYTEGSAEALGQAGAISGRTNLASLAWYNPSALAGTARPVVMLGNTFVQINTDFSSDNGSTNNSSMEDDWIAIPHFYYVHPLSDDWTAMLSVNAPYGLISEWPNGWSGRFAAIYSELRTTYTTPSIAYRINENVALSAGFNIVYVKVKLTASRDLSGGGGPDLGSRTVEGDDLAFGYTASAHWNISENWSAGARFQSRVKVKAEGDVKFDNISTSYDAEAKVALPSSFNVGLANHSLQKLHVGLDFVWTEWSTYDDLSYVFESGYPLTNPEVISKRWDEVWSVRVGGEYELNERWVLRAGYVWDQSPIQDDTLSPELPGSDSQMLMGGGGWKWNNIGVDIAYSYLWGGKSRTGSEVVNANSFTAGTAGEYDVCIHFISLSGSYTF